MASASKRPAPKPATSQTVKKTASAARASTPASKKTTHGQLTAASARVLNVRPDGLDFRDSMYVPTLVEVPVRRELSDYRKAQVPVLDQRHENACTGYGLATVAHYLLRTRRYQFDNTDVSPHMLYELARRYDEWAGEVDEGSSCRGAMKGWYKHGVCPALKWPAGNQVTTLTEALAEEAAQRPLGAYFRVNHTDIVAMHSAIAEVGVLYASATVHDGWYAVAADGRIQPSANVLGGHAFAIVAYDQDGFWLQNSWGETWGHGGFAHLRYDDWLVNGADAWVARLGAPISLRAPLQTSAPAKVLTASSSSETLREIRPHVISLGNDGAFNPRGDLATTAASVQEIFEVDFPRITAGWGKKRIVVYAHGGLVTQAGAIETVAGYRAAMLPAECYPLAFVWKTDYWSTLGNMLADAARRRRSEGVLDATKDFMLDRLDDALEPIARLLTGKAEWDEMKENGLRATVSAAGGARVVAKALARLAAQDPSVEIHLVGHSAGSILLAPLVQYLVGKGAIDSGPLAGSQLKGLETKIASCHLWAPACTVKLFRESYLAPIRDKRIEKFGLFTLTDQAERDDHCAHIYNKSLLYLVGDAFEDRVRIPLIRPEGEPILGMARFVASEVDLAQLFGSGSNADWVRAPNDLPMGHRNASAARHHGDFDNDEATIRATLERIRGQGAARHALALPQPVAERALRRRQVDLASSIERRQP
ncbi:C1 family peptidase [Pseudomonas chlororaphis]|uniref:C1 family peptidase n=1 Tax=Pseudomonas chlororaphis TaxID=587753 RepID=UPI001E521FD4|nr:C1 family peptidase [Pseudomonas chlororaphis]MCB2251587.1 C1 family peptidase [Pseudomonas chlororaphis]